MSKSKLGQLLAAEQKKKEAAAKKAAKSGKEKEPPEDEQAAASAPVNIEDYKGARKVLRHAVKAVVKVKSESIAKKLVDKVEQGDMRGTEMVLKLIEKKKPGKDAKKKKKDGPSWAELLASEPEWDESMAEDRGQGSGIREQKAS
jgi:hypothetical protein